MEEEEKGPADSPATAPAGEPQEEVTSDAPQQVAASTPPTHDNSQNTDPAAQNTSEISGGETQIGIRGSPENIDTLVGHSASTPENRQVTSISRQGIALSPVLEPSDSQPSEKTDESKEAEATPERSQLPDHDDGNDQPDISGGGGVNDGQVINTSEGDNPISTSNPASDESQPILDTGQLESNDATATSDHTPPRVTLNATFDASGNGENQPEDETSKMKKEATFADELSDVKSATDSLGSDSKKAQRGILKSASRDDAALIASHNDTPADPEAEQQLELHGQSMAESTGFLSNGDNTQSTMETASPAKTDFYIDGSGNLHDLSQQNSSKFYPDLRPPNRQVNTEDEEKKEKDDTSSGKQPSRTQSAAKTVHFDESGPQVTELDDEDEDADTEYEGAPSEPETTDSISLPRTSPAPSREATSADLFSTQVDEETLEAAKIRQRRRTIILEPEAAPVTPVMPTMSEVVDGRARQHYECGVAHMKLKEYERAISYFNKTLNLTPKDADCYKQRAEAYLEMCDFQAAILNYKRACVLSPANKAYYARLAFIFFFQGQCLFDQKLYPEALEAFSRAAEMRPEVVGYHTRSIACLAALQRHGECLALVNKRLETDDSNADLYVMRARLHELFRNTTLSYYDVKDALGLDPNHEEAKKLMENLVIKADEFKNQATQLNLSNRHRDALQKISLAIETNPSVPEYHITRGALHRRLGDFNAAIDDYLLALDKTDHNEDSPVYQESQRQLLLTYNDFAVECFTKGFFEEAVILLNKAIKGEKREKGLYINRGDCFFRQNNMQFALADYHQALELDLTDENIRSRIAIIHNEYGIAEYQDKNYPESEARFTLAIQQNPKVGQYYISRAKTRQMMENISAARSDLLMALHLDPSNEEIIAVMSRLFPGKSVKDVMSSQAAMAVKAAIGQILGPTASPRLEPIDSSPDSSQTQLKSHSTIPPIAGKTWKPMRCFPTLKSCMEENDFNIKIAKERKKIQRKVSKLYQKRDNLRHTSGRVIPLPDPISYPQINQNLLKKETFAVPRPPGWRKFTLGIGLTGVPDNV